MQPQYKPNPLPFMFYISVLKRFTIVLLSHITPTGVKRRGLERVPSYQRVEWKSIIQFYAQIHPVTAACCCQLRWRCCSLTPHSAYALQYRVFSWPPLSRFSKRSRGGLSESSAMQVIECQMELKLDPSK